MYTSTISAWVYSVSSTFNARLGFRLLFYIVDETTQADNVAVLQDGKVVETGSYAELMSKEGGLLVNLMEGGGN